MKKLIPGSSRRRFLAGASAAGAISVAEWLGFFRNHGVPGTSRDWGLAQARAQVDGGAGGPDEDRFLVYWYLEGGWDSYSMLGPVDTANDAGINVAANTLDPTPPWSQQLYRPPGFGSGDHGFASTVNGITHGYLAADGRALFPDMAVVSSHKGNTFHSGGRFDLHYGRYEKSMQAARGENERSVMQAFAEQKGANFLLPNVSWHRWLADGELDLGQYPEGTGYYEKLGPAYAHTVYGRTPRDLKARLTSTGDLATQTRRRMIRGYTDNLTAEFIRGRDGQSVRAFASALDIHHQIADRGVLFDVQSLFTDAGLREEFGVNPEDEITTATSVNEQPARSKESPHIRCQAMMAYELMRAKISCALWIESRDVRLFDSHVDRRTVLSRDGNSDQLALVRSEIWSPLTTFVNKLKATPMPGVEGTSLYDRTTIVLCSEMARTIQGNVDAILAENKTVEERYKEVLDQDVCQHWHVSSVAFLGGNVRGGTQFGKVGNQTLDSIPIRLTDGSLDPAYNATTGVRQGTADGNAVVTDAGNVYATALYLSGVDPAGKGLNEAPPLTFVKKPT